MVRKQGIYEKQPAYWIIMRLKFENKTKEARVEIRGWKICVRQQKKDRNIEEGSPQNQKGRF